MQDNLLHSRKTELRDLLKRTDIYLTLLLWVRIRSDSAGWSGLPGFSGGCSHERAGGPAWGSFRQAGGLSSAPMAHRAALSVHMMPFCKGQSCKG